MTMKLAIDRRALFARLGGAAAVAAMSSGARAEALEHELMEQAQYGPACAESDIIAMGKDVRLGAGLVFDRRSVSALYQMPDRPSLTDFFRLRFADPVVAHCLKSASRARKDGQPERYVMAALVHDISLNLMKSDHAWWGADLVAPYVDDRIAWAIRNHQALRFFPDAEAGYEYPALYRCVFGEDFTPEPYIQHAYEEARRHKWYMESRMITVNDTYGFVEGPAPTIDEFEDIIGRNWRAPEEGLGYDASPAAHMWRALINPERPL